MAYRTRPAQRERLWPVEPERIWVREHYAASDALAPPPPRSAATHWQDPWGRWWRLWEPGSDFRRPLLHLPFAATLKVKHGKDTHVVDCAWASDVDAITWRDVAEHLARYCVAVEATHFRFMVRGREVRFVIKAANELHQSFD